jgi:hypothetical protein
MDTKLLLISAAFISILLLGCTGVQAQSASQQQQSPAQNPPAINARTGANVENTSAPPTQPKQHTCSLTLSPSVINAGSSTEVGFAVQSEQSVEFTYNCGNEIRGISSGGLTSGSRLCQFNTPGNVDIWIKADGVVCAQKTLTVQQPQTAKTCYIDQSSVKRDLSTYNYEARVQFTGFSSQDVLVWICDHTTARHTLGGDEILGMPLYSDIYCDFPGRPESSSIDVSIAGVSCGSISTR